MYKPKVSIIIPLFNSVKYLTETIQSALAQTWSNKEIIIVDDGSIDGSYEIAKRFESTVVKVYSQKNQGACAARNKAFELSSGDYIQYLDSDDLLEPDKIEKQIIYFEKYGNKIIVFGNWGRFKESVNEVNFNRLKINKDYLIPLEWLIDVWNGKGMTTNSSWLTPRQLVEKAGNWNVNLLINQDGEFFSRVLLNAKSIYYCNDAKAYYRSYNENSISQFNKFSYEKANSLLLSFILYKENILAVNNSDNVRNALSSNYYRFIYETYPLYPTLLEKARIEIKNLNITKSPSIGGKNFQILAKFIGFKNALKIREIYKLNFSLTD